MDVFRVVPSKEKNGHQIYIPPMNAARYYFTMVSIRNQMISIGGLGGENTMETIEINATGTWIQQSMPFSVRNHCTVTFDNNVIVIGGRDENNDVSGKF